MVITWNGRKRFANNKYANSGGHKNPYYPEQVNEAGGMRKVARSNIGRNMFIIMDRFHVLPNDPLIQTLTVAQRDFLFESIQYDNDLKRAQAEGREIDSSFEDESEDYLNDIYNSNEHVDLVSEGDNMDDLYNQVKEATNDPAYEAKIDSAIDMELHDKKLHDARVDEEIKQNFEEAYKRADALIDNDEEDE